MHGREISMKRKLLAGLLVAALSVAALTGCGGNAGEASKGSGSDTGGTSSGEVKENDSAEGAQAADESVAGSGDVIELTMWGSWGGDQVGQLEKQLENFNTSQSQYHVTYAVQDSMEQKLLTAIASNEVPDIVLWDRFNTGVYAPKGALASLDDYIAKDGVDLSQYGSITDQVTVDGKLYELPFRSDFWVLFYNKDVFDKAGVAYPGNDMTFEQYDQLARSVTNTTPGEEVYGAHYHTWRYAVQLFGILDGKHSIVDGDYEFLKPYYEMIVAQQEDGVCQDYATLKTSSLHYSGAFAQGNVAMMNMGSWFIPTLIEKIKTGEYGEEVANWGIVKYPHAEGVEPGSTLATITCLSVPTAAPHKDLAWEFVKFVCGPDGAEVVANTGTIPAITTDAVVEAISGLEGFPTDDASAEALKTANTYLEMPVHEKSSEIETVLNEAHDNIMTEGVTIDEGIAEMTEGVKAVLGQ